MVKGLYTGYTGMLNEQYRMDIMSNNLANADTVGFKKEGSTSQAYSDVMAVKIKDLSEHPNVPKELGDISLGVKIGETYTDYSQGSLKQTDNTFDLALSGDGFFAIETTNDEGETSIKYTRSGEFTLTQDGFLVNKDGNYVMGSDASGDNKRIQLNPNASSTYIDRAGRIYQNDVLTARIQITDFQDYDYLSHYGETMWQPVEGATTIAATNADVYQGYLEMSNISVVNEMVNMIAISRSYEANQKVITTYDDSLQIAANQLGKV